MSRLATLIVLAATGACASGETVPSDGTSSSTGSPTSVGSGGAGGNTTSSGGGGAVSSTGGATTNGSGGGTGGEGGAKNDCGNGVLDPSEACDDALLGTATCTSIGQGFIGGTLACAADCTFDTSACTAPPNCGNGAIDTGEQCDGTNLDGKTCGTLGMGVGTLACSSGCAFDTSNCHICGNGAVDGPEVCDGPNLSGQTCLSRGHDGGTLSCASGCLMFDESQCTDCGDGTLSPTEACDGANLGGQTCQTQGFSGGTLACTSSCTFNVAGCTGQTCGNNLKEGTEICDGTALGGQTCQTLGFIGGTLGCNATCTAFMTTSCTGSACSDSVDNDADRFIYSPDPDCTSPTDNDESVYAANCMGLGGPIYDITFNNLLDITVTGSTVGGTNAYSPTDLSDDCTTATGPETVFFYRNAVARSPVYISTDNPGTNFDTVLYIRQASCGTNATAEVCNDDDFFIGGSSEIAVNLPVGDFFIIVDGYNGQAGNYELTIDFP